MAKQDYSNFVLPHIYVKDGEAQPSISYGYGTYADIDEAYEKIVNELGSEEAIPFALTIGIKNANNSLTEYYWNGSEFIQKASGSGSGSGSSTCADEVYVGSTEPTDEETELWVNPSVSDEDKFGATINSSGHLVLTVPDVEATIKAKYNGSWLDTIGGVSGSGGGSGSSVSVTALLNSGTQIATIVVDGTSYALYAPVGGSGGVSLGETSSTAYRGDRGKVAYEHSQLTSGNPHEVKFSQLSDKPTKLSEFTNDIAFKTVNGQSILGSGNIAVVGGDSSLGITTFLTSGEKIATISIGETSYDLYAPNGGGGVTYSEGNYISISNNAISVNLTTLKSALDYSSIITTNTIDQAVSDCSGQSIVSALGYTPANATNEHTHSNKSVIDGILSDHVSHWNTAYTNSHTHSNKAFLDELTSDSVLKSKVGISNYVKKIGDTMTGKLIITGKDSTTIGSKSVDYSLWLKDNQLMEFGKYLSWYGADVTNVDGADMPWYGIGAYEDNDGYHKTHIAGYYGVCLHTNGNEYVRLYGGTGSGKLRIGNGVLCWDSAKSAFYMYNAEDGSNCNLYATGGISAYGMLSSTPLDNLTVTNTLKAKNVNAEKLSLRYGSGDDEGQCDVTASENGWQFVELAEFVAGIKAASIEDVVTNSLKVGGGSIIKKIVVDSSIKSGDSNACVAISIGSNVYYVNAVKE